MKKIQVSKELLFDLYSVKKLTSYQIADLFDCSQGTIWKRLRDFKIPANSRLKIFFTKEQLQDWYLNKKMSTWKIEKEFHISRGTVHRKLKEWNIPSRDIAESHISNKRSFSGSLYEKAYLIGFRIGDLHIRLLGKKSRILQVRTGTTVVEQAELFEKLFSPYCKVWKKETSNGKINLQAGLDLSFSFLLEKNEPNWVFEKQGLFFSFLAGFVDAEGCIKLSNKRAYFSLGNMSKKILQKIKKYLAIYKVNSPKIVTSDHTKYVGKDGYGHNGKYYILPINRKKDLLYILKKLLKFSKHGNKIKDMRLAIENIEYRNKEFGKSFR